MDDKFEFETLSWVSHGMNKDGGEVSRVLTELGKLPDFVIPDFCTHEDFKKLVSFLGGRFIGRREDRATFGYNSEGLYVTHRLLYSEIREYVKPPFLVAVVMTLKSDTRPILYLLTVGADHPNSLTLAGLVLAFHQYEVPAEDIRYIVVWPE